MTAERDKANFWAHGWIKKRNQYLAEGVDPLDLRAVRGRMEVAMMRRRWAIRGRMSHPTE